MNYILYCAFGDQRYINEAIYSILSLFDTLKNCKSNINIVVFSDNTNSFKSVFSENHNVVFEYIPDTLLKEWLNGTGYMPRLKIKALQHFFNKYKDHVIFIDTDTLILDNIDFLFQKINEKQIIMHSKSPAIDNVLSKCEKLDQNSLTINVRKRLKLYGDIKENGFVSDGHIKYEIPTNFSPHNSGVIGMNYGYEYLLNDVLKLSDIIYSKYNFRCAEEFAFTSIAQRVREITLCEDTIYHYSYAKHCRYIIAYLLKYFHYEDNKELENFLKNNDIESLDIFDLKPKDIPYFMHFAEDNFNIPGINRDQNNMPMHSIYYDENSTFFKAKNDIVRKQSFLKKLDA